MHRIPKLWVLLMLLAAAVGCWGERVHDARAADDQARAEALTAFVPGLWPGPYILVCWEQPGFAAEKQLVRDAVEDSWMRHSRLVFADWGPCKPETFGIRITLENGVDPAPSPGSLFGRPRAEGELPDNAASRDIRLTFDFVARAAEFPECATGKRTDLEACIRSFAVHELGHALGFVHEQARTEVAVQCTNRSGDDYASFQLRSTEMRKLGPFDHDSIMAFCAPQRSAAAMLSPNDIFYLQQAYGRKTFGALVAFDGRCLDFAAGDASPSPAQLYECLGGTQFAEGDFASPHQHVIYDADSGKIMLAGSERVMEVLDDDPADGQPLQLNYARDSEGQRWSFPSVVLRGMGGMCVAPMTPDAPMSSELVLMKCDIYDPAPEHLFAVTSDRELLHKQSGLCLHAQEPNAGSRLVLAACSGAARQHWELGDNSALKAYGGQAELCVDVGLPNADFDRFFGSDAYNRLQLYDCNAQSNQMFSVAGPLVGQADKCAEVASPARGNGSLVRLGTCNAQQNQVWELYW
jgi:hypothetical protein